MGLPMAQRLIDAHYSLTVYNRTASKLAPLQTAAIAIAPSAAVAIAASDCIILMLTDASAIRELLLSDSSRSHLAGRTVIQMSTIAPIESQTIRDEVVAAGGSYLEAPVLGSIPEARSGSLIVMVGAEPDQFTQWSALLETFGSPVLLGSVGAAATVKLALNQLIGSLTSAFAVSLGLVMRQGLNPDLFMTILRKSALYAPTFDKKLQRMLDRDYQTPNFPTKHLKKDIELFISAAQFSGLEVDGVEGVNQILTKAMAMSFAEMDYAALFSTICKTDTRVDPPLDEQVT